MPGFPMSGQSIEVESLDAELDLPARIAALQFANWGCSTGYGTVEEYEQFLCEAAGSRELPTVLVARRGRKFVGSVNLLLHEMTRVRSFRRGSRNCS
jgi:hypothetical protein